MISTNSLIFDPTTTWRNVTVEIREDNMAEKRREFSISIERIAAMEAPDANLANSIGGPITIVVYDNDCEYLVNRVL
jgi:hypothetical protein